MRSPTVTIVYVAFNRRDELRDSLRRMLFDSEYHPELVDVIVVDNASEDGTAAMVREEFPQVQLIAREENIGAPAWNDGFAEARGDWVLILDDDAYLPREGLGQAFAAAHRHEADLVSFKVVSTHDPDYVFSDNYRTGLLSFWGCAWLIRRSIIQELGGYDPQIFMWANELELMLRFYDRGYRHLHLPEVVAQHMKAPGDRAGSFIDERGYRINAQRWGYIAAKLLRPRDAAEALLALVATDIRDGLRVDRVALRAVPDTLRGFVKGMRCREAVRNPEVSRIFRRNSETFASPWWLSRPLGDLLRSLPRELSEGEKPQRVGRREQFYAERPNYYPETAATLQFSP